MPTSNGNISYYIRDEQGNEKPLTLHAEITYTDAADRDAVLNAILTDLDAPIAGRVVKCVISEEIDISAATRKASPEAGSWIRTGATLSLVDSAGNANPIFIPTVPASKFTGNVLNDPTNPTNAELKALVDRLITANTSGTATITVTDEDDRKLDGGYRRGFRTTRK